MTKPSFVRSALFVPGDRPERFVKALATGADVVIVDLEDAVEDELKAQARENLQHLLSSNPHVEVVVRVNGSDHPEHQADVAFCAGAAQVRAVILPKAQSRTQVEHVGKQGLVVWPLIETVQGVEALAEIAGAKNVERLTYGALDFGVELGLKSGTTAANRMLDQVRFRLLTQSVRAGLPRPLETVFADIAALDKLAEFAKDALNMGFEGMLCIHPKQVAVVNESFSPTQDELAWAASVLEASLGAAGAFRFEGKMIDAPVLAHARRLIGES